MKEKSEHMTNINRLVRLGPALVMAALLSAGCDIGGPPFSSEATALDEDASDSGSVAVDARAAPEAAAPEAAASDAGAPEADAPAESGQDDACAPLTFGNFRCDEDGTPTKNACASGSACAYTSGAARDGGSSYRCIALPAECDCQQTATCECIMAHVDATEACPATGIVVSCTIGPDGGPTVTCL